jgi:DNA polymerase/3'-5' exonuclease PolX
MMNVEIRYQYQRAIKVADYIIGLLKPHCVRIHLAGSLRRIRPEVKDIEIVCEPKKESKQSGLFPDVTDEIIDRSFIEALAMVTEIVILGKPDGRYMKIKTSSKLCPGINLDLFMPQPDDYYRIYAIRTGSRDYAASVIAHAWKRKGWCGVDTLGLRLISECDQKTESGKNTYKLKKDITQVTLPPVWKSEADFFSWIGIEYKDPALREYTSPVNIAQ